VPPQSANTSGLNAGRRRPNWPQLRRQVVAGARDQKAAYMDQNVLNANSSTKAYWHRQPSKPRGFIFAPGAASPFVGVTM